MCIIHNQGEKTRLRQGLCNLCCTVAYTLRTICLWSSLRSFLSHPGKHYARGFDWKHGILDYPIPSDGFLKNMFAMIVFMLFRYSPTTSALPKHPFTTVESMNFPSVGYQFGSAGPGSRLYDVICYWSARDKDENHSLSDVFVKHKPFKPWVHGWVHHSSGHFPMAILL